MGRAGLRPAPEFLAAVRTGRCAYKREIDERGCMAPISRGGAPESASWRPLRPRPPATPPSGNPAKAAYGRPNREQTAMARGADFLSFDGKCQDKVGPERVNEEAFRPNLSEGDAAGLSGSLVLAVGCSPQRFQERTHFRLAWRT